MRFISRAGVKSPLRINVAWGPFHAQLSPPLSSLSTAKSKPIIAEPEIHGAQPLDGVTGFLVLMSEGLYKALEAAHGPGQANQVSWARVQRRPPACGAAAPRGPSQGSDSLTLSPDIFSGFKALERPSHPSHPKLRSFWARGFPGQT